MEVSYLFMALDARSVAILEIGVSLRMIWQHGSVTTDAIRLHNPATQRRRSDIDRGIQKGEGKAMVKSVQSLYRPLPDGMVRHVAVVAHRHMVMVSTLPVV